MLVSVELPVDAEAAAIAVRSSPTRSWRFPCLRTGWRTPAHGRDRHQRRFGARG
jgi:hypothetical protein